jgi:hypothetical protein
MHPPQSLLMARLDHRTISVWSSGRRQAPYDAFVTCLLPSEIRHEVWQISHAAITARPCQRIVSRVGKTLAMTRAAG